MQNMMLIDFQKKEIKLLSSTQLFAHYRDIGLITMSELKGLNDFDKFVKFRKDCGDPIFYFHEYNKISHSYFQTVRGGKTIQFVNLDEIISYIRKNRISTASDAIIRRSIVNNVSGKTKNSYGSKWESISSLVDIDNFELKI